MGMDASRRLMIETAAERFGACGGKGLALKDLARRLGVSPGTIFKEFKTRDELFVAVLGRVQEGLFAHIEASCSMVSGESGLAMAVRLAEAYSRFLEQSPEPYLGLMRGDDDPLSGLGPQSRGELRRIKTRIIKQFETLLRLGSCDGSVRPDAAEDVANRFVNVLVGLVRLRLTRPETRTRNLRLMLEALAGGPSRPCVA